jgi:hypothetical protein
MPAIPLATLIPMIVEAIQKLAPMIQQMFHTDSVTSAVDTYNKSEKTDADSKTMLDALNKFLGADATNPDNWMAYAAQGGLQDIVSSGSSTTPAAK